MEFIGFYFFKSRIIYVLIKRVTFVVSLTSRQNLRVGQLLHLTDVFHELLTFLGLLRLLILYQPEVVLDLTLVVDSEVAPQELDQRVGEEVVAETAIVIYKYFEEKRPYSVLTSTHHYLTLRE